MKRKYIIPAIHTQTLVVHRLIADSPDVRLDDSSSVDAANVGVKEQHLYNIWDDDWRE